MKKIARLLSIVIMMSSTVSVVTSCGNASRYADDIWKAVDDKIDDGIKIRPPKKMPKQKTCGTCHGSGYVYDIYGFRYECSNCNGDGKVWFN